MDALIWKFLVIVLIFLGEGIAIYAELLSARTNSRKSNKFLGTFLKYFIVTAIGGILLVIGTTLGFRSFQNIWIVSVSAITSILIIEPALDYLMFKQLPTKGALIGLILGTLGFIAAIFF